MHRIPLFVATLLLCSCGKEAEDQRPARSLPSLAVQTKTVRLESHVAVEDVVGTVRSKLRAMVEPKVSGRVMEYLAVPGEIVKSGDLLARLDVQEIEAKVDQANALLDQAQRDFDRQKQLMASNATTRQEYDAADARMKVAAAGVREAETLMGYASVKAPFDGVVTRKFADIGDLAMPGKPLLEIEAPMALRFEADLPEAILDRVKMGMKMQVTVASAPKSLEATVSEIAPVADPVSRTFQVKLDLPTAAGLRTGQFGRVSVPVAETQILSVPTGTVIQRGQMELVYVIRDQRANLRLVKTGKSLNGNVEILSGLEEGEQIIVSDLTKLADGQPVTVQP